jgi:predicted outer membrane repeat protein
VTVTNGFTAEDRGGAVRVRPLGSMTASGAVFSNSVTIGSGGAVSADTNTTLAISNCTVSNNTADNGGGISSNAAVTIRSSVFMHNTISVCTSRNCVQRAGAVGCWGSDGAMSISDSTFVNNSAGHGAGGAVYAGGIGTTGSQVIIERSLFNDNSGSTSGVALFEAVNITLIECNFYNNTASGNAGAIRAASGDAAITQCTFVNNTATDTSDGGAVHVRDATATIYSSTFDSNSCDRSGGAIWISGGVYSQVVDCSFTNNKAIAAAGSGGAMFIGGGTTLDSVTIKASNSPQMKLQ